MNHNTIARTLARGIRLFVVAALLAAMVTVATPPPVAQASTFVVDTSADDLPALTACTAATLGDCSLRGAITRANTHLGPDTITFAVTTNGAPIVLAGLVSEDDNVSGDLDILLDSGDLTIQGNGAANTIVDGGGIDRVFHVCPDGGCANTVILNGVTIRNGNIVDYGGGIYNYGGTTTVDGSTVISNTAKYGGGIYNEGTLNVRNGSAIGAAGTGNEATIHGGGIYNRAGTTTVDGSTVISNTASSGGGIYNYPGATTTVDGSTVSANTAEDGGGIYNRATLTVQNGSTIGGAGTGNEATDRGGGIYNRATLTVQNGSTVSANTAEEGGGIFNRGTLTVNNSTIGGARAGNLATIYGGGIYNDTGGTTVDGSTVSANTADDEGGGIYNMGTLDVTNSTIGGAGTGNTAQNGGGIVNYGTTAVDGSTISANTAQFGGGIYNYAGTTTVDGSTVSANTAQFGSGICSQATLNVQNGSTIGGAGAGNQATFWGGRIYNHTGGTTMVDGSTVSANTAESGGGIYNWGTLDVTSSTIGGSGAANQATIWGGGIYNRGGGTTAVMGSCILNNRATSNGGGLYNDENTLGATKVTGSSIVGNSAKSFFNNQAGQQIATGNWWGAPTGPNTDGADTFGGDMDASDHLTATIVGCLFFGYLPVVQN